MILEGDATGLTCEGSLNLAVPSSCRTRVLGGRRLAGQIITNRLAGIGVQVGVSALDRLGVARTMIETMTAGIERRLARGVVAGTAAGLLFLLANMWFADSEGMPAVAPLWDTSTIFHFADKPDPTPENLAVGLIVHLALAAGFGALFAVLAGVVRGRGMVFAAGAVFGLLLYVVNFQILGRGFFEWFQEGPNQLFEVVAHLGYGLALVPFVGDFAQPKEAAVRERRPTTASAARA